MRGRTWAMLALTLVGTGLAGRAAELRLGSEPPLPVPNLLVNPGVEEGADGRPQSWAFGTATPAIFESDWRDGGRSGRCLWLKARTGEMSGYWAQSVAVVPGTPYLAKGHLRILSGKILCYVHGTADAGDGRKVSVDARHYRGTMRGHWLTPVFVPLDALSGPDAERWHPFRIAFTPPAPVDRVALSLGLYFAAGEALFDDLEVCLAEVALQVRVEAAAGEVLRRVVVRADGTTKPILDSGTLPEGAGVFTQAIPGQPSDGQWTLTVTLADGRTLSQRYPKHEGEAPR